MNDFDARINPRNRNKKHVYSIGKMDGTIDFSPYVQTLKTGIKITLPAGDVIRKYRYFLFTFDKREAQESAHEILRTSINKNIKEVERLTKAIEKKTKALEALEEKL